MQARLDDQHADPAAGAITPPAPGRRGSSSLCRLAALGLLAVLGTAGATAGNADTADGDSITEVYEAALANDHGLAEARATYRAGLEEELLGRAELLPRIDASANYEDDFTESRGSFPAGGFLFDNSTDTSSDTLGFAFNLRQPLFNLPAWFRFQQGQALTDEAEAVFAAAQQDLIVRVSDAYLNVLRANANLRSARAQETAVKAQLEQAEQRFEVGMVAITDVNEARAAYDLAVAERLATEGEVGISLEQLSVLTGQQHAAVWQLREDFPISDPEPDDAEQWVQFALENSYDIKAAAAFREAAGEGARAASSAHMPTVELQLGYSESNQDLVQDNLINNVTTAFPNNRDRRFLSLNVQMPLFAGGGISAARRQALANSDAALERYLGTVRNVTQQARAFFIRVRSDAARTRARKQSIVSSRSALDASEAGYEVGTRDIVDVLAAQRTLFAAVRDYANARIDYVASQIQLKRQAGTLNPGDLHMLNQWLEAAPAAEASGESEAASGESAARP